ncbi:MAG: 3-oxoacyl-[acyl-carrier-protein] reductase [Candidatus Riflebacteria bacterium]|nr:3-oxoacyl-[acyl-carrier-protein] reductase [Candidatus Riflebacteria bacterium]
MQDLKDRVALVTGGTRGIGREIATLLSSLGSRVALTGTQAQVALSVAAQIRSRTSHEVLGVGLDVANDEDVDRAIDSVVERFGRLDVLVSNAGVTHDNLLLRMSAQEWDRVLQVNLRGAFLCTRRALKTMLRQRSGVIICISSVVGLTGSPGQANYAAAKAGLIGLTRTIAREYAAKGIRANVVAPGFIDTDMTSGLPEARKGELLQKIPLGRVGVARDVAQAVAFLASDLSSYVTGQVLSVDGGLSI